MEFYSKYFLINRNSKKEVNMFYAGFKAKDLIELEDRKFEKKVLLEDGESKMAIIALKKEEIINSHISVKDAAVFVLDGEIEIHFEAEKFTLGKGEIIMFEKEKEHTVRALKDSKFILVKI